MKHSFTAVMLSALALASWSAYAQQRPTGDSKPSPDTPRAPAFYFPERLDWQHKRPNEVGMDVALVAEAVKAVVENEIAGNRDLALEQAASFGRTSRSIPSSARSSRGAPAGSIAHNGYIVAEWGEPMRVDMTNSVTKTFLTTVVGLAWQRGLIRDFERPRARLHAGRRRPLRRPSTIARSRGTICCVRRATGRGRSGASPTGPIDLRANVRRLAEPASCDEPGTHYKYNDVRVKCWRSRRSTSGAGRCPISCARSWIRSAPLRRGAGTATRIVGRNRRSENAVCRRRRPLGRRNAHQRLRHGALRLSLPAQRQMEGPPDRLGAWIEKARTPGPANDRTATPTGI